jgi:excinuclease ABC subunit C
MKYTNSLPSTIGIYIFRDRYGKPLYVGKSVNIKARVKSHFENAKLDAKERAIVENSTKIETIPTESEFKALLLESQLIQKHRPKYNRVWMDDKSYLYVKITVGEEYPKIFLVRKSDIEQEKFEIRNSKFEINSKFQNSKKNKNKTLFFGPFSSRRALESLLREIRRVIPFCTAKKVTKRPCFYSKIGLCNPCPNFIDQIIVGAGLRPAPWGGSGDPPLQKDANICVDPLLICVNPNGREQHIRQLKITYGNNIKQIVKIFEGKTDIVLKNLRHELDNLSEEGKYEEAILIRDRIMKFEKLISERSFSESPSTYYSAKSGADSLPTTYLLDFLHPFFPKLSSLHRIECYDVSNLGGKQATAAMTAAIDGQIDKSQYRKFKILTNTNKKTNVIPAQAGILIRNNPLEIRMNHNVDWELMRGIFERRFKHSEWEFPNLLLVDGGKPQVRMAISAMQELKLQIPVVGIAKNPDRLVIGVSKDNVLTKRPELNHSGFNLVRLLRDEAHRFGRKYHLLLRHNTFLAP